eukprot:1177732-Prorocentrum_minimum.AAC.1
MRGTNVQNASKETLRTPRLPRSELFVQRTGSLDKSKGEEGVKRGCGGGVEGVRRRIRGTTQGYRGACHLPCEVVEQKLLLFQRAAQQPVQEDSHFLAAFLFDGASAPRVLLEDAHRQQRLRGTQPITIRDEGMYRQIDQSYVANARRRSTSSGAILSLQTPS